METCTSRANFKPNINMSSRPIVSLFECTCIQLEYPIKIIGCRFFRYNVIGCSSRVILQHIAIWQLIPALILLTRNAINFLYKTECPQGQPNCWNESRGLKGSTRVLRGARGIWFYMGFFKVFKMGF